MPQRIVAIACVRNEADIIEAFVRHTLTFADNLVVVDHDSIDSTRDILAALRKEGLPLEVQRLGCVAQLQAETLTSVVREQAASRQPDWIVPLDVDEFLVASDGDVRAAIEALPTDVATSARMKCYVPEPSDDANVMKHVRKRVDYDAFPFVKIVAIPGSLCGNNGELTPGNHGYLYNNQSIIQWNETLLTAHVPFRSPLQLQAKAVGWINHLMRTNARAEEAVHWKDLFADFVQKKLGTWDATKRWALRYARYIAPECPLDLVSDPLPVTELRYLDLATRIDPRLILEDMARRLFIKDYLSMTTINLAQAVEKYALARKAQKQG